MDSESESKLLSVLSQIIYPFSILETMPEVSKLKSRISQTTSLVQSIDWVLQPKPESEFISLIKQIISFTRSVTDSEPEFEIVSLIEQMISLVSSADSYSGPKLEALVVDIFSSFESLYSDSELKPPVQQLWSLVTSRIQNSYILLTPQAEVELEGLKFRVTGKVQQKREEKGNCDRKQIWLVGLKGDVPTHFFCLDCNGEDHEECEKAPVEVKHPLHPKHSLQLVLLKNKKGRDCYCCNTAFDSVFYYCSACDFAMSIACLEKRLVRGIDSPRHPHTIYLFPRQAFLACNICGVADISSPIYMCAPCNFVVHQKCLYLPRVIKISRHPHRISFTPSFGEGEWSCGVCQRKINKAYGGYFCIKDGCSYAAHSRCASQNNVWDGKELEGEPEEIEEEEVEPYVRISDGIIQHFSHQHHHLRLDENRGKEYDDDKLCEACVTPIYFGKFYSCMQCEFILHETCANLSKKIHHPIHPHLLTLVGGLRGVLNAKSSCSACPWFCTGFFYTCDIDGCHGFKLHVQCATISEPLVHEGHMHPNLYLTSKPGEERECWICTRVWMVTFNCIECNFSLCFACATLPQKLRYKHDKHVLTLSYGKESSTMTNWCEVCERKLRPKEWLYKCDEYCCVTLHINCVIGTELYMKPGLSMIFNTGKIFVLPSSHHMNRLTCTVCKVRWHEKYVFQSLLGLIYCRIDCLRPPEP